MHGAGQGEADTVKKKEPAVRLNRHTGVGFLQKASFLGGLIPSFCHLP